MAGPPALTPAWFWRIPGLRGWKKLRAFSAAFLWYSHAVPWNSLLPAFETILTWLPAVCPYSAVHRHDRALAAIRRILVGPDVGDADVHEREGDDVAPVHGQVLYTLVVDQVGMGRRPRFQERRGRSDLHLGRQAADRQREIHPDVRAGRHLDVALGLGREAFRFDLDLVRASRQGQQVEEPYAIRPRRANELLLRRRHRDQGIADHAAAGIPHIAADRAGDLGVQRGGTEESP
jgi:hypothetical protein